MSQTKNTTTRFPELTANEVERYAPYHTFPEFKIGFDDYVAHRAASTVEIMIADSPDGARLWVHADGELMVRIYRIGRIVIDDRRTG